MNVHYLIDSVYVQIVHLLNKVFYSHTIYSYTLYSNNAQNAHSIHKAHCNGLTKVDALVLLYVASFGIGIIQACDQIIDNSNSVKSKMQLMI